MMTISEMDMIIMMTAGDGVMMIIMRREMRKKRGHDCHDDCW